MTVARASFDYYRKDSPKIGKEDFIRLQAAEKFLLQTQIFNTLDENNSRPNELIKLIIDFDDPAPALSVNRLLYSELRLAAENEKKEGKVNPEIKEGSFKTPTGISAPGYRSSFDGKYEIQSSGAISYDYVSCHQQRLSGYASSLKKDYLLDGFYAEIQRLWEVLFYYFAQLNENSSSKLKQLRDLAPVIFTLSKMGYAPAKLLLIRDFPILEKFNVFFDIPELRKNGLSFFEHQSKAKSHIEEIKALKSSCNFFCSSASPVRQAFITEIKDLSSEAFDMLFKEISSSPELRRKVSKFLKPQILRRINSGSLKSADVGSESNLGKLIDLKRDINDTLWRRNDITETRYKVQQTMTNLQQKAMKC